MHAERDRNMHYKHRGFFKLWCFSSPKHLHLRLKKESERARNNPGAVYVKYGNCILKAINLFLLPIFPRSHRKDLLLNT